jgi:hypothetical protein
MLGYVEYKDDPALVLLGPSPPPPNWVALQIAMVTYLCFFLCLRSRVK